MDTQGTTRIAHPLVSTSVETPSAMVLDLVDMVQDLVATVQDLVATVQDLVATVQDLVATDRVIGDLDGEAVFRSTLVVNPLLYVFWCRDGAWH